MISKILPAWTFYVPQIDGKAVYCPSIENNFQAQIHISKIASPTVTAIEFCPGFLFLFLFFLHFTTWVKALPYQNATNYNANAHFTCIQVDTEK